MLTDKAWRAIPVWWEWCGKKEENILTGAEVITVCFKKKILLCFPLSFFQKDTFFGLYPHSTAPSNCAYTPLLSVTLSRAAAAAYHHHHHHHTCTEQAKIYGAELLGSRATRERKKEGKKRRELFFQSRRRFRINLTLSWVMCDRHRTESIEPETRREGRRVSQFKFVPSLTASKEDD